MSSHDAPGVPLHQFPAALRDPLFSRLHRSAVLLQLCCVVLDCGSDGEVKDPLTLSLYFIHMSSIRVEEVAAGWGP